MTKVAILLALSGCWHFSEPEEPAPSNRIAPSAARRRPAPRADVASRDTAPSSGSPAKPTPASGPALSTSSPARPATPAGASRRAPPPCVNGRVISATYSGAQRQANLVVGAGANSGVSRSWTATLMDPAQTPARLIDVQPGFSRVVISGVTFDQIRDNPIVALCP
jgi:hypothetical protein